MNIEKQLMCLDLKIYRYTFFVLAIFINDIFFVSFRF